MNNLIGFIALIIICISCNQKIKPIKAKYLVENVPDNFPINFKEELIPKGKLIHRGVLSPDLEQYFYTISNNDFQDFNIYVVDKIDDEWSNPRSAFFNSKYDDHGMSFSTDGNTLYFSSTRPVGIDSISPTWHIWKTEKINGKWVEPYFVSMPSLNNKLVSHPSISENGTLYFHSSNLDYSEMDLFFAKEKNGKFENVERVVLDSTQLNGKCTPFISPQENYLIYAAIGNQLDLMISYKDNEGNWAKPKKLNDKINNEGQGNPYVSPDGKYLFYATGNLNDKDWNIKWVDIESLKH
ncbi:MAG: PD40 domain-containing protein [Bacteroidia bacterium]|nr:PD40 domain-containing protein [Bacteroidia bacterium]